MSFLRRATPRNSLVEHALVPALDQIVAHVDDTSPTWLVQLLDALRPGGRHGRQQTESQINTLLMLLQDYPSYRQALRSHLLRFMARRKQLHLYTDTGIFANETLITAVWRKLSHKLLPPTRDADYLQDMFGLLFHHPQDHVWLAEIPADRWQALFEVLDFGGEPGSHAAGIRRELMDAAQVLSYRISALGLEPELVRYEPSIEAFESAFLMQNVALRDYLESEKRHLSNPELPREDHQQVDVLLDQCVEVMTKVRRHARQQGISVTLTYLLGRCEQLIARLRCVLQLLDPERCADRPQQVAALLVALVRAENRSTHISDLLRDNIHLLARQVTEHASHTGEHYIANNRADWLHMFKSGMGAGLIVGFMACVKVLTAKLKLAPLQEAFAFSMNYSLGFMLIHVLSFTIATKQPAMTASRIAASIQETGTHKDRIDNLAELIERVMRTQFIAIVGNVVLALPVAYLLALLLGYWSGTPLADATKSAQLLHDLDPLASLAIPHAAIAGVCLFLAGLISGYYDNKALYNNIPGRIRQHPGLRRILGQRRLDRVAGYLEHNLGALAGNFYFGIMLGSMGTVGYLLGLPLDIRHITFSTAYLGFALVGLDTPIPLSTLAWSVLGVAGIGVTNLAVSFSLALVVAMRSRNVTFRQSGQLVARVWGRFRRQPWRFFWPASDPSGNP